MKILFYDAKKYDIDSFDKELADYASIEIDYLDADINVRTAALAKGYDAVCAFVSSDLSAPVLEVLHEEGVGLILLRCAGFNNVNLEKAKELGLTVLRVPGYSPEAVAEHAMTLAMSVNRRIHKEYIKVRENNFSLEGLMGINFYGKTAGIIGTGKIGAAMARICRGFGMRVIAYDKYPNPSLDFIEYKELEEVFREGDLISLHCPLTIDNYHMINAKTISLMKDQVCAPKRRIRLGKLVAGPPSTAILLCPCAMRWATAVRAAARSSTPTIDRLGKLRSWETRVASTEGTVMLENPFWKLLTLPPRKMMPLGLISRRIFSAASISLAFSSR